MSEHSESSHHHILSLKTATKVLGILLVLTAITVWASRMDFGRYNFTVAMFIAVIKALLVILVFMGMRHDNNENRAIFFGSFVFFGIFIVLTFSDVLFRGDHWRVKPGDLTAGIKSVTKFKRPWNQTPEILAHGKTVFVNNCASCHGEQGLGNGAAAGSLNPKPRNFTKADGWKGPRKLTHIYDVVTNGLKNTQMPAFPTLSTDDRWSVGHFVLTFGAAPEPDTAADFAALKINSNEDLAGGASEEKPSLPIDFAIEVMATDGKLK